MSLLEDAVRDKLHLEVIQSIVTADGGQLESLLHRAGYHHPSRAVLFDMIDHYPELLKQADRNGRLPLHCALGQRIRGAIDAEILNRIIDGFPQAAEVSDSNGHTPLAIAVAGPTNGLSNAVIQRLISLYPRAIATQDDIGRTPLFLAACCLESLANIRAMFNVNPNAVRIFDNRGKNLLHGAFFFAAHRTGMAADLEELFGIWKLGLVFCDHEKKLPMDELLESAIDYLEIATALNYTREIVLSFLGLVNSTTVIRLVPAAVKAHTAEIVKNDDDLQTANDLTVSFLPNTATLQEKQVELIRKILVNDHVQAFVQHESYETLVAGMDEMNRAGLSDYRDSNNRALGVHILNSLSNRDNVDAFYVLLREQAGLCGVANRKKRQGSNNSPRVANRKKRQGSNNSP